VCIVVVKCNATKGLVRVVQLKASDCVGSFTD